MELKYAWSLHARDSQLPPPGDWDTWMILAGRGFGKTHAPVPSGYALRSKTVPRAALPSSHEHSTKPSPS